VPEAALARGHVAVGFDVDERAIAEAREAFSGRPAHFRALDVASESAVQGVVKAVEAGIGPIAGVVKSAGIGRDVPCRTAGMAQAAVRRSRPTSTLPVAGRSEAPPEHRP
jgi:NAD(P)-dependent dehydrogenase (short-subunit alcohol dehydrogenase family)